MANPNNTPYTAQGASKIYLFLGVSRQDLANIGLNLKAFPRYQIAIQSNSEQSARAKRQHRKINNFFTSTRAYVRANIWANSLI